MTLIPEVERFYLIDGLSLVAMPGTGTLHIADDAGNMSRALRAFDVAQLALTRAATEGTAFRDLVRSYLP
jgi:hypothetical protein